MYKAFEDTATSARFRSAASSNEYITAGTSGYGRVLFSFPGSRRSTNSLFVGTGLAD